MDSLTTQNVGGQYFRPAGVQAPGGAGAAHADEDTPAPAAKPALKVAAPAPASDFDEDDTPVAVAPVAKPAASGQNAQDILAMIRSRQAK